jgi:hypothetical protein
MSYCIEYGDEAEVCFCKTEKKPIDEYLEAMKWGTELKCYCEKHMPRS